MRFGSVFLFGYTFRHRDTENPVGTTHFQNPGHLPQGASRGNKIIDNQNSFSGKPPFPTPIHAVYTVHVGLPFLLGQATLPLVPKMLLQYPAVRDPGILRQTHGNFFAVVQSPGQFLPPVHRYAGNIVKGQPLLLNKLFQGFGQEVRPGRMLPPFHIPKGFRQWFFKCKSRKTQIKKLSIGTIALWSVLKPFLTRLTIFFIFTADNFPT